MSESKKPNEPTKDVMVMGANSAQPQQLDFKLNTGKRKIQWKPEGNIKIDSITFAPGAPITDLRQAGTSGYWEGTNDTSIEGTWSYTIQVNDEAGHTTTDSGDGPPEVRNGPPPDHAMGPSGADREGGLEDPPEVRSGPPTGS